ncbi:MAG: bacterioferritin-associated ferredoxin [Pseudomonadota bacterium]
MFVCICKSVTDKQIRKAALKGADTLYELHQELGVASGCGSCADSAQEILDEVAGKHAGPSLYVPSSA